MTLYNLFNNNLQVRPVKSIRYNGKRISNPPDELVLEIGAGYPLQQTEMPEYNEQTQYVSSEYKLENNVIVRCWTIHDIEQPTEPEPKATT